MTIASALTALNTDIVNARTAITNKGGTVTSGGGSSQLATDIATIPGGTDNYAAVIVVENTLKGTSYVEATEIATACDDISYFLYGTANS